ncbi:oligosaccharide flippase family protein [Chitinivorax sp. B]|uniref:oligosaccharide flippase family protein n=1 Tax=Chitinivorax sp. B TaxID=2502235 RepID=UPI001484F019|nr:oligosaccharide flippase family protein [Chitinivorax sp. B]
MPTDQYSTGRLRTGIINFLIGKIGTALLNLLAFFLLARLLRVADYGAYMTFLAIVEIVTLLATGAFDRVAAQLIPEYRLNAGNERTARLIWRLFFGRTTILAMAILTLAIFYREILAFFNQSVQSDAYLIFLVAMFAELAARYLRDGVLGSLLMQGWSQIALFMRNLAIVVGMVALGWSTGSLSLVQTVWIEVVSSTLGFLIVLPLTYKAAATGADCCEDWRSPGLMKTFKMVWHNYVCLVLGFIFSAQTVTMLASKLYGVEVAAVFGFARGLADQVRKYLPAELFLGVVRPVMIAGYAKERDFSKLNWRANLVYKIGLFSLFPIIAIFGAHGDMVLQFLHGGKYPGSQYYVLLLLITLIPLSHKRAIEMVVNSVHETDLWLFAALSSLLAIPFLIAGQLFDLQLTGLILAVMLVELLTNSVLTMGLKRRGYPYVVDWNGFGKLILLTVVTTVLIYVMPFGDSLISLFGMLIACVLVYLGVGRMLRPFSERERASVNALLKRNLFVW